MRKQITERRKEKIIAVASARQDSLRLVLENVHDPHNVSAVFRSCDAVGIPKVSLIYNIEKYPKIGSKSSASAFKWVEKEKYTVVEKCYQTLHEEGFTILASSLKGNPKSLYDFDLTKKVALVFGNEHRGISDDAESLADNVFYIPMQGMVQSLNISVAAAVTLYEAMRQRMLKGLYDQKGNPELIERRIEEWLTKK
ncbi:MAG: RNA methyltransferase [Ignavibacteriaceae bacterium]|nr:RNA methyltransferase [Ignavibacteriaceae bacterium]